VGLDIVQEKEDAVRKVEAGKREFEQAWIGSGLGWPTHSIQGAVCFGLGLLAARVALWFDASDNWKLGAFFVVFLGGWMYATDKANEKRLKEHLAGCKDWDKKIEEAKIELARVKHRIQNG
jgi:hypothetical protein